MLTIFCVTHMAIWKGFDECPNCPHTQDGTACAVWGHVMELQSCQCMHGMLSIYRCWPLQTQQNIALRSYTLPRTF